MSNGGGIQGGASLPEKIELGTDVQIWKNQLLKQALADSGLKFEAWNKLKPEEQDEAISKTLDSLKTLVADGKPLPEGIKPIPAAPKAPASPAKAARGDEIDVTHHLHPDYAGPLTGDQAEARHRAGLVEARIKAEGVKTKAK